MSAARASRGRIAQLANFYGPTSGGLRTAVDALGRGYAEAGCERFLIIPGERDAWLRDDCGATVTIRAPRIPGGYRMVLRPARVLEVLDRIAPDAIEVSDKATMTLAARWARERGVRSVLFSHEHLDGMLRRRLRLRPARVHGINLLYRRLDQAFDEIVVTSDFAAAEFERAGVNQVRRIPLGVDLDTFHPNRRPADRDASADVPQLVHAGRLSLEKRPDLAIATAVQLHRRGVPFHLHVYGDGPDRDYLARLAGSAPVTFHGFVPGREALAARLAGADVALAACPSETFGLAILEALACGTAVVTADDGGGRELVNPACGASTAPDPRQLATAVEDLLARPRNSRRIAARRQAERYPWSATVDAFLQLHLGDRPQIPSGSGQAEPAHR